MNRSPLPNPPPSSRPISLGEVSLEASEWLLASGLGGFAMGTALAVPTRRYHAWLIAALTPPVGRIVALHSVVDALILEADGVHPEQRLDLSTFNFQGARHHPPGHQLLVSFEKDLTIRWKFRWGPVTITRELALLRDQNAAVIRYRINAEGRRARLELRPLTPLRDFHALLRHDEAPAFRITAGPGTLHIHRDTLDSPSITLGLSCPAAREVADPQWWRNFEYDQDRLRGQDFLEDLFSPGLFTHAIPPRRGEHTVELLAWVDGNGETGRPRGDLDADLRDEAWRLQDLTEATARRCRMDDKHPDREPLSTLVRAADQFVVGREPPPTAPGAAAISESTGPRGPAPLDTSIIAGYPWFSDWGRDAMISLPGLLLSTGRFYEAQRLLKTFARHARAGLIPNCFDDLTGRAEYNTADASLWFIHAACRTLAESGDRRAFDGPVRQACLQVIEAYRAGTEFNIRMDRADGLIAAGDATTQLTWMDARRDGVTFTPRHGKPVEVNALWFNALLSLADAIEPDQPRTAREFRQLAEQTARSFRERFVRADGLGLHDCLTPDATHATGWRPDDRIRPNQILAVSLPHSALTPEQQQRVIAVVRARLLTPHGLRTLDPGDPGYKPRYEGSLFDRDGAYHNGTVWPWLIGPYAEAILRTGKFSAAARTQARAALQGLLNELDSRSIATLPEIYDAEDGPDGPRGPQGCIAQAWSVAEVLRALVLCHAPA
ncbi:MAG: glycogen debranching enzyme family protein [Phycisphaerales bacterium]|nr:glycogen debranching enzyme family protein [Phycisphaerales bacterium]